MRGTDPLYRPSRKTTNLPNFSPFGLRGPVGEGTFLDPLSRSRTSSKDSLFSLRVFFLVSKYPAPLQFVGPKTQKGGQNFYLHFKYILIRKISLVK